MKCFPANFTVGVISPAGRIEDEVFAAGTAALQSCGAKVKIFPAACNCHAEQRYLAAGDELRAADIQAAFADSSIDLILASRGGYGCARVLDMLDWEQLRQRPVMLAGFSDITALHWAMIAQKAGIPIAAPMLKYLAEGDDFTLKHFFAALRGEPLRLTLPALRGKGRVKALPLPGNLTVAASLAGTQYFPDTAGKTVILEDVGEKPYRLDRALTQLRLAGAFSKCEAVVFGRFSDCGSEDEIMSLLCDFSAKVECPVFYDCPFGHETPMLSINTAIPLEIKEKK